MSILPNAEQVHSALEHIVYEELDWQAPLPAGEELVRDFDSLQLIALLVAVEDRFGIRVQPEEEQHIRSVADLVDIITQKLHAKT